MITGGKYSGSPTRATVSAPFRFTGNFDTAVPAADIFRANGYDFYLWPGTPPLTEYNCGELKITRSDAGEVRVGEAAMELDYDYASYDGSRNATAEKTSISRAIPVISASGSMPRRERQSTRRTFRSPHGTAATILQSIFR